MDVLPFINIGVDMSPLSHRDRRPAFLNPSLSDFGMDEAEKFTFGRHRGMMTC